MAAAKLEMSNCLPCGMQIFYLLFGKSKRKPSELRNYGQGGFEQMYELSVFIGLRCPSLKNGLMASKVRDRDQ